MRIHFIGIGGIGVSALAQYYLAKGYQVSGSDLQESEITKFLQKKGVKIFIGHRTENLPNNTSLVIYTSAVSVDNPELKKAKTLGIRAKTYAEALGDLTREYFTIAVSGAHGKSTTTAMIGLLLVNAGFDPTIILGTKLKEFGDSNFRMGSELPVVRCQSPVLVIEADEYKGAFLNYSSKIIVLTNIEREHLDYFKNLRFILKTYKDYISRLPKDGFLVFNKDDKNIFKILRQSRESSTKSGQNPKSKIQIKTQGYSLKQKESKKLRRILKVPGEHNVSNALAALAVARILKIPDKIAFEALSDYRGAWRRFEIFSASLNDIPYTLVSDYGHHPTEIKATLKAARQKYGKKRLLCIFQPHQIQRTKILFKDFVKAFDEIDYLILNEIYNVAGREEGREISSGDLAKAIQRRWRNKEKKVVFVKNIEDVPKHLKSILEPNNIVLVMGAGNIYDLALRLKKFNR